MSSTSSKDAALWVIETLRHAGYQALLAGGCVRDQLLGVSSSDYDVATDATPDQVHQLFRRVLLVGAKFGVAVVLKGKHQVEVATFRSDISYSDGRRPDKVAFSSPREDALRRDFTINGMFYDPIHDEIIDYVGGQEDLRKRVVRTIGDPNERFAEDYLRMLRAVRFTVRLDFQLDPATAEAIQTHAGRIKTISGERILDELSKMLSRRSAPDALTLLAELHLAQEILPELFVAGLWKQALGRVRMVAGEEDLLLAMGALLCGLDRKTISRVLRRWGGSNELRDCACWLAEHRNDWQNASDMSLAKIKRLRANPHFGRLLAISRHEETVSSDLPQAAEPLRVRAESVPGPDSLPRPLVSGSDLKQLGLEEGPILGQIHRDLYEAQLNEEIHGREDAMALAGRLIGSRRQSG